MCHHIPQCPDAWDKARFAASTLAAHPDQGWSLLCNGVIAFDDGGGLFPDGRVISDPAAVPSYLPMAA
jgi:Family of unknown function (DUF5999)